MTARERSSETHEAPLPPKRLSTLANPLPLASGLVVLHLIGAAGTKKGMAKFKPVGSRKATAARSNRSAIPCFIIIIGGFALIFLLFYELLKSGR